MAQQTDEVSQRSNLARNIAEQIKGFDAVIYPTWQALFAALNHSVEANVTLCLDEFPYMVKSSPSLPSVIQQIMDEHLAPRLHIILCGSSQQMMQGLILDSSEPLYGRASEIMKIKPLEAGWVQQALACDAPDAVKEYAVWGGVPRYWELRLQKDSFEEAVKYHILDTYGVLHEEPGRLFLDDLRESVQAYAILSLVARGCHRISEIASRLGKPASQLSRPMDTVINLGYVRREVPFGELEQKSKRGVYKINDPFMRYYFTYVVPNMSRLELNMTDQVYSRFENELNQYVSLEWEHLCRSSVPVGEWDGIEFNEARRWWGYGTDRSKMELDVVAESVDKKYLLAGECKWTAKADNDKLMGQLQKKVQNLPFAKDKKVIYKIFLPENSSRLPEVVDAGNVMNRLRL